MPQAPAPQRFSAPYAADDDALARDLLAAPRFTDDSQARIDGLASRLIGAIREGRGPLGTIDDLLQEFALSTQEGLALMVLAEALLRVPDAQTADQFIEDKLREGGFARHDARSKQVLVSTSAWALALGSRLVQADETPDSIVAGAAKRLGAPVVRAALRQAMRLMGNHFVLGETIEAALLRRARTPEYRYSFDMLGEGARSAADADRHFAAYRHAIETIGRHAGSEPLPNRPGISIKLSALHPRYQPLNREHVLQELAPRVLELAVQAKSFDLNFTVDAEEAERLELSLDLIGAVVGDAALAGWEGFGLAVQAYQKRAAAVIDHVHELAVAHDRRLMVRLVKGAYWDTEIKRAQEGGFDAYPVFTTKAMTDLNYLNCARRLVALRPRLFAQFATHNALTAAAVLDIAGTEWSQFEFQRLHGMGEVLYRTLKQELPQAAVRTYAPVGQHRDLLAYLVRRLLENGANSSFVAEVGDRGVPLQHLLERPWTKIEREGARAAWLPLPLELYAPARRNSRGLEFGHHATVAALLAEIAAGRGEASACPLVDGVAGQGPARPATSPIDPGEIVGSVVESTPEGADAAVVAALRGFPVWTLTPADQRASILERAADLFESRRGALIGLLQREAGKTLDDAVAEVREAADFCRYYASEGKALFAGAQPLPGPSGETNSLALRGRGAWAAIAPWNFPLAIFVGQIAAALMAGNSVVAKPAEQTPLIGSAAVKLLHEAGVPVTALHLAVGDGAIGARLVGHPDIAGVVFTGSTAVARAINRALAAKDGPIVPLIAETGGINAMIVDATALPEQVADDVMTSAFRSAGQRCSSLRLLCLQEEIAEPTIRLIAGAARELKVGDPRELDTDVGPIIDRESAETIRRYLVKLGDRARIIFPERAEDRGQYLGPRIVELSSADDLQQEVFGPVLHVVRYRADRLPDLLGAIERKGFGLTLGIHSRINATVEQIVRRQLIGNVYVNRNIIGAVVGTQPFGGFGLSGTGPKAGGPNYLRRFATEQVVTINTAACGGNAALLAGGAESPRQLLARIDPAA